MLIPITNELSKRAGANFSVISEEGIDITISLSTVLLECDLIWHGTIYFG